VFEHKDPMKIMDKESQMYFDSSFRPAPIAAEAES